MKTLFDNLMNIVKNDEDRKFYYVDKVTDSGEKVRIFSYHYASYSDWLQKDALACRGIMFSINEDGSYKNISSRPMDKFFNYGECPFTMDIDFSKFYYASVMDKLDGSLISTYMDNGVLKLKSKTSISSPQAKAAMRLLDTPEYAELKDYLTTIAEDFTVNMEYTSPNNRIVLPYEKEGLKVLNVRGNSDGRYYHNEFFLAFDLPGINDFFLKPKSQGMGNIESFIESIQDMTGIEGYVIVLRSFDKNTEDLWFKVKTKWYKDLHKTKDSVNNNKALFSNICGESSDDLKALFHDDPVSLKKIETFENIFVKDYLTPSLKELETLREKFGVIETRESKRDYALACKDYFKDHKYKWLFNSAMNIASDDKNNRENLIETLVTGFMQNVESFIPEEYKQEPLE